MVPFRRSIVTKLMVLFFLVGVSSLAIIGIYSYYKAKSAILQRTLDQLTSIRVMKKSQVLFLFNERSRTLDLISRSGSVIKAISVLDRSVSSDSTLTTIPLSNHKIHFDSLIFGYGPVCFIRDTHDGSHGIWELKDTAWVKITEIVTCAKMAELSRLVTLNGGPAIIDLFQKNDKDTLPFCFQGIPVKDVSGTVSGTLALGTPITEINNIMLERNRDNGLGNSGESYLVGSDFMMRSNSRFIPHSVLKTRVLTTSVSNAFSDLTGSAIIDDYRTIPVLSSYSGLGMPGLNWVVIAEIDYQEAMIPIVSIRNDLLLITFVISVLILSIARFLSKSIAHPIISLKNATRRIANGEFGIRVMSHDRDEIGLLGAAFNEMASQLETERNSRMTALYDGQEIERQRVSRELHDGLGQMLVAMKIRFENCTDQEISLRAQHLPELREDFSKVIEEVRKVSNDLAPAGLTEFGLDKALKILCADIYLHSRIPVDYSDYGNFSQVKPKTMNYLYRISQEGLNNAVRHSRATRIQVQLTKTAGKLVLMIEDNGTGFDTDSHPGNGLFNMKERARLLGGTFDLETQPGNGTTIRIKVPDENGN
ncbi:MAG TPA: histidine kinase [Bacteroidales bacterium]|nr:histidine kinase [Bacteroidales bacterium]